MALRKKILRNGSFFSVSSSSSSWMSRWGRGGTGAFSSLSKVCPRCPRAYPIFMQRASPRLSSCQRCRSLLEGMLCQGPTGRAGTHSDEWAADPGRAPRVLQMGAKCRYVCLLAVCIWTDSLSHKDADSNGHCCGYD